jgi:hypothetical protein
MTSSGKNRLYCHIIAALFFIMLVRYRAIFVLILDPSRSMYAVIVVSLFYLLNFISMVGLFFQRRWGFIVSYVSIPLSTFLFATSYLPWLTDWLSVSWALYLTPGLNAVLLIFIIHLHRRLRREK